MTSSGECKGDRASAVRLGQDMVSHGLLSPLCAGYGTPNKNPFASATEARVQRDLLHSFDDAVGWLFAYAGDALRDPFAAPPPTKVVVMTGTHLNVSISDWIEVSVRVFCAVNLYWGVFAFVLGWQLHNLDRCSTTHPLVGACRGVKPLPCQRLCSPKSV